ncbi:MAG: hypothetical protein H6Q73_882 [Firmicutes bacterium]|nr:hypothetical protein [Bacillota bacterium]
MQIQGYSGFCAGCFWPIGTGDEKRFRENGRKFCPNCFDKNGYYQRLEKRMAARKGIVKSK